MSTLQEQRGLFQITLLNVTEKDIKVNARKFVGFIHPVGEVVARIDTFDNRSESTSNLNIKDIAFSKNLQPQEKSELKLISEYSDVFSVNPKKPKLTNLTTNRIITDDTLPV